LWLAAWGEPHPAMHQPAGLEKKNFTGAYERPVTCFGYQDNKTLVLMIQGLQEKARM